MKSTSSGKFSLNLGQSLIEVIVAIGVFTLGMAAIGALTIDAGTAVRQAVEKTKASFLASEGLAAVRAIRSTGFSNLANGVHGLSLSSGVWNFVGSSDITEGQFVRSVAIEDVELAKKKITSTVTWRLSKDRAQNVSFTTYLSDFLQRMWIQSTEVDFNGGKKNGTQIKNTLGGEVELALSGDWTRTLLHATGNTGGSGDVNDIALAEDKAYTVSNATAGNEFSVFDISDISSGIFPTIGGADISGNVMALALLDGYAFLATDIPTGELAIVRLSDNAIVNSYDLPVTSSAIDIAAQNGRAYISVAASGGRELFVIDISSPESPLPPPVSAIEIGGNINSIAISEGYAYLATSLNTAEIRVLRLSDNSLVNALNLPGNTDMSGAAVSGGMLYASRFLSGSPELYRIDIASPENPLAVAISSEVSGGAYALAVPGDGRVYVASGDSTKELVVHDASTLAETGLANLSAFGNAIAFFGGYAYVGTGNDNPEIVVLRGGTGRWSMPVMAGVYDAPGTTDAGDVFVSGNYAYLATGSNGSGPEFYILDITDPFAPVLVPGGSLNLNVAINEVFVSGNYAYLATGSNTKELIVVDITNKSAPFEAESFDAPGSSDGLSIFVSGTVAYLGTANSTAGSGREFYTIDVSSPTNTSLFGTAEISGNVNSIWVEGTAAYLATSNNTRELTVINISNPALPFLFASYNTSGNADAYGVEHVSGKAYLVTDIGATNFYILNVSSLPLILPISSLNLAANGREVAILGSRAFLATQTSDRGLMIADISDSASPSIVSVFDTGSSVNAVEVSGTYAFLSGSHNTQELQIVGEGINGTERVREGRFISSSFGSGNPSTVWQIFSFGSSGTGMLRFQLRTASTEAGLSSARWVGPDGTSASSYNIPGTVVAADPGATGTEWVEYKAFLDDDGASTPVLEYVTISYN